MHVVQKKSRAMNDNPTCRLLLIYHYAKCIAKRWITLPELVSNNMFCVVWKSLVYLSYATSVKKACYHQWDGFIADIHQINHSRIFQPSKLALTRFVKFGFVLWGCMIVCLAFCNGFVLLGSSNHFLVCSFFRRFCKWMYWQFNSYWLD